MNGNLVTSGGTSRRRRPGGLTMGMVNNAYDTA
jgi:hypothetical protein